MNVTLTQPISSTREGFRNEFSLEEESDPTDSKVKGLVLGRIGTSATRGALLPSATAPRVVINLLSAALAIPALEQAEQREVEVIQAAKDSRRLRLRRTAGRMVPVGLRRSEPQGWMNPINAMMQFLMVLPGFIDLFYYAPRSFHCFLDFIEQYLLDQQENKVVSAANSLALIRCLMKKLSPSLFRNPNKANLFEIFHAFVKALFPQTKSSSYTDFIALHPERHLIWDVNGSETLEEAIKKKWNARPADLLVYAKGTEGNSCRLVKRQFFTPDWLCYDLQTFIEHRPDGPQEANFLTYVKVDGSWYQCDDERVSSLRSHFLQVPLHRGVLLYYKRIEIGKTGWF